MRNPNGYGSVYKLSGKNRRRPYAVKKTVGFDDNGNPQYIVLGYFEKRLDAMNSLAAFNSKNRDPYNFNAALADIYKIFLRRKDEKLSASGKRIYAAAFNHLSPFHSRPIRSIRTMELQSLIDNLDRKWQTKSHIITLLNQLFDIAIELDICEKNYAKYIVLENKPNSELHKPFTEEEIQILFNNLDIPFVDTILILIYSGMRPSEMLLLEQKNINLDTRIMIGGIKTEAGKNRHIPICKKILPFIESRCNGKKYLLGDKMLYNDYRLHFNNVMEQLQMSHLPHDGRHTFATLMGRTEADPLTVKRIMGHSSKDITEKIYTHKDDQDLLKAISYLE